jgi:Icc-related predicted phosphoesterase
MPKAIESARHIAADLLTASGRIIDADIVLKGGGDDFGEVQVALQAVECAVNRTAILERALHCYADVTFWDAECPEASLAFHDQGEIARAALVGKELYEQHRD